MKSPDKVPKHKLSTPCWNHVPLGVINPVHNTELRQAPPPPDRLTVQAHTHEINYHNHDHNEIENKQSLPKRLAYPRVYVQQIIPKYFYQRDSSLAGYEAFLKKKEFQDIFLLFKRYAKLSQFRTEAETIKSIRKFSRQNSIEVITQAGNSTTPQYLYNQESFINYLVSLGFTDNEADEFWQVAYNQARFQQSADQPGPSRKVISMRAFVYNFKKFYLEEMESFKNCLSQAALRQRLIDLRLFLEPWFKSNIIFKQNYMWWKELELSICTELQRMGHQELKNQLIEAMELRDKIWLFMRTLAKIIFPHTDQKNIGLQIFNQRATDLILKHTSQLQVINEFMNCLQTQLLNTQRDKGTLFKVTQLVVFAQRWVPDQTQQITSYLRGLFKYLYFSKNHPLLSLNRQTLNLDCSGIIELSYNDLMEYLVLRRKETNRIMDMIEALCDETNEVVDARPDVTGPKAFLNECNHLSESLLKMVRRCDFLVFFRLQRIREVYHADMNNLQQLKDIFDDKQLQGRELDSKFWKNTFSFEQRASYVPSQSAISSRGQVFEKNYRAALDSYEDVRKKLQGRLPNAIKKQQQEGAENESISKTKSESKRVKKDKTKQQSVEQVQHISIVNQQSYKNHSCTTSSYCALCDQVYSTDMSESLNRIDSMSDYLMDMLKDVS